MEQSGSFRQHRTDSEDVTVTGTTAALLAGIAGKVFVGEAYPSGTVYVQPFAPYEAGIVPFDNQPPKDAWPKAVSVYCLLETECKDSEVGAAPRVGTRTEGHSAELERRQDKQGDTIIYDHIPSREGMTDTNNAACKLSYKRNPKFKYMRPDFFETMGDHCVPDSAVMRYTLANTAKAVALQVLAVDLELDAVERPRDRLRPLTAKEQLEVVRQKSLAKRDADACVSEPQYLDAAKVLVTARVKGAKQSIRVSSYTNPGCGGHLSNEWVLDVIEDGVVTQTARTYHTVGVL